MSLQGRELASERFRGPEISLGGFRNVVSRQSDYIGRNDWYQCGSVISDSPRSNTRHQTTRNGGH